MKNFFNEDELQAIEALQIKGGLEGPAPSQYECVNNVAYCGGGVLQRKCVNSVELCGLSKDPIDIQYFCGAGEA